MRSSDGETAIALAGTVASTGPGEAVDLLETPGQLARWLEAERDLLGPAADETALRLQDFRALRGAIRELFLEVVGGEPLSAFAVETLNEASAAAPAFPRLELGEEGPSAVVGGGAASPTASILATIARSAIELLGDEERNRLRICPAARCGRFFLATRPGQVWCSGACGNRVRVARHYARVRAR